MAQLVARSIRDAEVACSSQVAPTNFCDIIGLHNGAWRSPVARAVWDREVISSNLIAPTNLIMDKSFRTRTIVALAIFFIAMLALYTFHSIPFKILYSICVFMAFIELMSFLKKKVTFPKILLLMLEVFFLAVSVLFIIKIDVAGFWYIILGVAGYDVFAYLFGKFFGAKIFKNSRPFPRISKGKTWEGTILGVLTAAILVFIYACMRGELDHYWFCLFLGVFAMLGDLFESFLKRRFDVKDSGEIISRNKFFKKIEALLGGANGHGGYLDRLDSISFSCTMIYVILTIFSILQI